MGSMCTKNKPDDVEEAKPVTPTNRNMIKKSDTPWHCSSCSTENIAAAPQCVTCHTVRPYPVAAQGVVVKPDAQPLPEGWEEREDAHGRKYFVDHKNKSTTYNDPRALDQTAPDYVAVATGKECSPNADAIMNNDNSSRICPDCDKRNAMNQKCCLSCSSKRPEGASKKPETTTLYPALPPKPVEYSTAIKWHSPTFEGGPLPKGWQQNKDSNGRAYFINHNAQTTTYEDP